MVNTTPRKRWNKLPLYHKINVSNNNIDCGVLVDTHLELEKIKVTVDDITTHMTYHHKIGHKIDRVLIRGSQILRRKHK